MQLVNRLNKLDVSVPRERNSNDSSIFILKKNIFYSNSSDRKWSVDLFKIHITQVRQTGNSFSFDFLHRTSSPIYLSSLIRFCSSSLYWCVCVLVCVRVRSLLLVQKITKKRKNLTEISPSCEPKKT